jgi:Fe2+ transport system protein FeoA
MVFMTFNWITCSMCGQVFDAAAHTACQSCPLNKGCQLVCCPACGFETVDPSQSRLARWAGRFFARSSFKESVQAGGKPSNATSLVDIPPGCRARVVGFLVGLSDERKAHLQSYGLTPGTWVRVVQHSPVTVIQVEQLELALEGDLARQVQVTG